MMKKYAHQPEPKVQNTGDIKGIWEKAKRRYEIYKFKKTYTRLGWMLHLVQDMAVPAHAFNMFCDDFRFLSRLWRITERNYRMNYVILCG